MNSQQRSSIRRWVTNGAWAFSGLAVFLILAEGNASACRCPEHVSPATCYERAQFVVTGKVVEVHASKGDGSTATVSVDRAWKANVPKTISISTHTSCAFKFAQGEEYLLYLFRAPDGDFYTSKCVGNLPLADAETKVKWLKQHASAASVAGP